MHPRSTRNRMALGAVALVAGLVLAAAASARPEGPGRHGFSLEDKVAKLELPAETSAAVQKVLDEARPEGEALMQKAREAHEAMRALLEKDPADEAAVMAQADVAGAAMTEHRKHELRTLIRVRALLTPEDRAELSEMMMMHHRHGRGR
jgi:Spy/CpxP family protein refolding chaperone